MPRGYFGIGIENNKTPTNLGTLWRSAWCFNADFIFTIGTRYKHQSSDTVKAYKSIPLFRYDTFAAFWSSIPMDCPIIGIEEDPRAYNLHTFIHPERAIYLLGAEDHGLSKSAREACHHLIQIEGGRQCLNVSVAGSIVMCDRVNKVGAYKD